MTEVIINITSRALGFAIHFCAKICDHVDVYEWASGGWCG